MSQYIRSKAQGGVYFFTLVTHERRAILCDEPIRVALRQSIIKVRETMPFEILAWVLLPDHLHCIWQLPENDNDYSKRWGIIKRLTTQSCNQYQLSPHSLSHSKVSKNERGIWQRRFYEHKIRNEQDFINHMNYSHYNPVKHGLVNSVKDWEFSTFHKYVKLGVYSDDWGAGVDIIGDFGE